MKKPFAFLLTLLTLPALFGAAEFVKEFPAGKAGESLRVKVPVEIDLSTAAGVQFDILCTSEKQAENAITIFAVSGRRDGYYAMRGCSSDPKGWGSITLYKENIYNTEKTPKGWGMTTGLDLVIRRVDEGAMTFRVKNVRPVIAKGPAAAVVFKEDGHTRNLGKVIDDRSLHNTRRLVFALRELGFGAYMLSDYDLAKGAPKSTTLVAYSDQADAIPGVAEALENYLLVGGSVLVVPSLKTEALRKLAKTFPARVVASNSKFLVPNQDPAEELKPAIKELVPGCSSLFAAREAERVAKRAADDAWVRSRPSVEGEVREIDCHNPDGSKGLCKGWAKSVECVKRGGYTLLNVNFCRGMYAAYPSKVLLPWKPYAGRDCIAECLAECRKAGLKLYAWRTCWGTPKWCITPELKQKLIDEGRCVLNEKGEPIENGGCPTHPENVRLEIESMVEMAHKGVDGINFDYIRYLNASGCFCARCRAAFEKRLGRKVENWPEDCKKSLADAWDDFRCDNISHVVEEVSKRVRKECPGVKICVSGFQNPWAARHEVGQDWPHWGRQGWIDEISIMSYRDTARELRGCLKGLVNLDTGKAVKRPLIGPSCWPDVGDDARRATEQIEVIRELGFKQLGSFELDLRTERMMDVMAEGPLR